MTGTLFDRFDTSAAAHPIDTWLAQQDPANWQEVPDVGLIGPESTSLTRAFDELPNWDEFVEAVRADLKARCRLLR